LLEKKPEGIVFRRGCIPGALTSKRAERVALFCQNRAGEVKAVPGMLVAIDPNKIGQMRVASRAYDTTAAGIISGVKRHQSGYHPAPEGSHRRWRTAGRFDWACLDNQKVVIVT
jgi:hypothetical protein